eukprot:gene38166-51543_t
MPIIGLLFQRGAFQSQDTALMMPVLSVYALGLPFFSFVNLILRAFYARKDTKTPVRAAVLSFAVNVVLSFALMGPLGTVGLAVAGNAAIVVQAWYLQRRLAIGHDALRFSHLVLDLVKVLLASAIMGGAVAAGWWAWTRVAPLSKIMDALGLGAVIVAGVGVYAGLLWALRIEGRRPSDCHTADVRKECCDCAQGDGAAGKVGDARSELGFHEVAHLRRAREAGQRSKSDMRRRKTSLGARGWLRTLTGALPLPVFRKFLPMSLTDLPVDTAGNDIASARTRAIDAFLAQARGLLARSQDRAALQSVADALIALGQRKSLFPAAHFPIDAARPAQVYRLAEDVDGGFARGGDGGLGFGGGEVAVDGQLHRHDDDVELVGVAVVMMVMVAFAVSVIMALVGVAVVVIAVAD